MNRDQFEGKWKQFKGKIKEKWGKLTDNDLSKINGNYDQFVGSLQERYGYQRERAEKEFEQWNWGESRDRLRDRMDSSEREKNFREERGFDEDDRNKKRKIG